MNEYGQQGMRAHRESTEEAGSKLMRNRYDGVGFNVKKRPKKLIRLVPLGIGSNIEAINRVEQDLMRDIRDIDQMLQKRDSNMCYIHGFLLAPGATKQLIKQFYSALQVSPDAVEDGFYLWRLREYNDNYELVSSKLIHSPRHFPQKLLDKSIHNLMMYDQAKHEQSLGKEKMRWNLSVKPREGEGEIRARRIKTDFQQKKIERRRNSNFDTDISAPPLSRKLSEFKQITDNYRSHSNPLQLQSLTGKRGRDVTVRTEPTSSETPSLQQLSTMLGKQSEVVSIWLPPSTCPQLMGVMSIQVKQKAYNVRYCLIKKYFFYRHGLSRRIFDSILHWTALHYGSVVELAILTTRDTFNALFSPMGWHLASWITDDRIRITYSGL